MSVTITQIVNIGGATTPASSSAPDADYLFESVRDYRVIEAQEDARMAQRRLEAAEARIRELEASRPSLARGRIYGLLERIFSKPPAVEHRQTLLIEDEAKVRR